jgi:hypothetical protein
LGRYADMQMAETRYVFEDMQFDSNLTAQFINKTVSDLLYYKIDGLSLDFE